MVKVVIADDEPILLRNLKLNIENLDRDFEVVGLAADGKQALELVKKFKPDIIFTDVKMPVMDGLMLAAEIKGQDLDSEIVIVSGYQEFEYAKRAITLGVTDYLVKPVNPFTLMELLQKMKARFYEEQREKETVYLQNLIHAGRQQQEQPVFTDKGSPLFAVYLCLGSYITYRNNQFEVKNSFEKHTVILDAVKKVLGSRRYWILKGMFDNEKIIVGEFSDDKEEKQLGRLLYKEITRCISDGLCVTMVYSLGISSAKQFRESIIEAGLILKKGLIFSQSQYICAMDWKRRGLEESTDQALAGNMQGWERIITEKDTKKMEAAIKDLLEYCRRNGYSQEKLTEALKARYLLLKQNMGGNYFDNSMVDLTVVMSENYTELMDNAISLFRSVFDMGDGWRIKNADVAHSIATVKEYMDRHFTEKLSIMQLADMFGFNYSYFCTGFKKYYGTSPNEYIISKRIEKAKELMHIQPGLSIKDIAFMAGYDNPHYFSRIFKTVTGLSPSQYKEWNDKTKS